MRWPSRQWTGAVTVTVLAVALAVLDILDGPILTPQQREAVTDEAPR